MPPGSMPSNNLSREAYEADVAINNLNLHRFLPQDSLFAVSARLGVKGEGSIMSPNYLQCSRQH